MTTPEICKIAELTSEAPFKLDTVLATARQKRPDYFITGLNRSIAEIALAAARNQALPDVQVNASVLSGQNGKERLIADTRGQGCVGEGGRNTDRAQGRGPGPVHDCDERATVHDHVRDRPGRNQVDVQGPVRIHQERHQHQSGSHAVRQAHHAPATDGPGVSRTKSRPPMIMCSTSRAVAPST